MKKLHFLNQKVESKEPLSFEELIESKEYIEYVLKDLWPLGMIAVYDFGNCSQATAENNIFNILTYRSARISEIVPILANYDFKIKAESSFNNSFEILWDGGKTTIDSLLDFGGLATFKNGYEDLARGLKKLSNNLKQVETNDAGRVELLAMFLKTSVNLLSSSFGPVLRQRDEVKSWLIKEVLTFSDVEKSQALNRLGSVKYFNNKLRSEAVVLEVCQIVFENTKDLELSEESLSKYTEIISRNDWMKNGFRNFLLEKEKEREICDCFRAGNFLNKFVTDYNSYSASLEHFLMRHKFVKGELEKVREEAVTSGVVGIHNGVNLKQEVYCGCEHLSKILELMRQNPTVNNSVLSDIIDGLKMSVKRAVLSGQIKEIYEDAIIQNFDDFSKGRRVINNLRKLRF